MTLIMVAHLGVFLTIWLLVIQVIAMVVKCTLSISSASIYKRMSIHLTEEQFVITFGLCSIYYLVTSIPNL